MARTRYLIIGDGAAGLTAAECLRQADPSGTIGLFSDEPVPGYFRAALTNYLLGELREDQIWAVAPDFYESRGIHRIHARVVGLEPAERRLWCSTSREPAVYDRLLIAAGARSRPPTFEGAQLPGVLTLRTLADARQVVDLIRLRKLASAVVAGGGALGLEWAHALREHGVRVTLIERAARFLPGALDAVASDLLATRLRQAGIEVILEDEVLAAHPGPQGGVAGVTLRSGRNIACEIVAAALGVLPNTDFLANTGISLAKNGAVHVDRCMRSSLPQVWAAGDVASADGEYLALWEPARHQARVAAENMLGKNSEYRPGVHYFATRLFDLDFARLGRIERAEGAEEIVDFPRGTGQIAYRKLVLSGGKLVGALLLGERALRVRAIGRNMKRLIDAAVDVSEVRGRLLDPGFDWDAWLEKRRLVEKPAEPQRQTQVAAAQMKKTHLLSLGDMRVGGIGSSTRVVPKSASGGTAVVPSRAPSGGTAVVASQALSGGTAMVASQAPRATKMLSIGLHAESAAEAASVEVPIDARLEGLGRVFTVVGAVTNLGQAPECQIVLVDPGVSAFHAQILRHADALYLRDLGSPTGTWLNAEPISAARKLADGDRIRIGRSEFTFRSSSFAKELSVARVAVASPRLEVRSGASLGLGFALGASTVLIGSGAECAVRLADPSVSLRHAQIRSDGRQHFLSDLGSASGTYARGGWLAPGQELALSEGEFVRMGAVDVLYTNTPVQDALSGLKPRARIYVDSGADAGKSVALGERLFVGSDPRSGLVVASALPQHLELAAHGGRFWVRDLSAGRAFRAGAPLSAEFCELNHGDLLLLGGTTMLRFEEDR